MSLAAWLTLATFGVVVGLLARERVSPALAVLGADVFLMLTGVIDSDQALAGFSNPAPFTIAALYVLARAVSKTGGLQPIIRSALGGGQVLRRGLFRVMAFSAGSSAFLNNTPVVAIASPQVTSWARERGWSPSTFLMPLSFAAILGGMVTAIGTSTTLVVSGLLEESGLPPIGMFEITPYAAPVAVVGLLYLFLAAPVLLPKRREAFDDLQSRAPDFFVRLKVSTGGPMDGQSVEVGGLRHLGSVFLIEVQRADGEIVAPAGPNTVLHGDDVLVFAGQVDQVLDLQDRDGLTSVEVEHTSLFEAPGHQYFEAVVGPGSPLVGRTLKAVRFRSRYQGAVVGIHRAGSSVRVKLGALQIRVGDTLLILSDRSFRERWRDRSDFMLITGRREEAGVTQRRSLVVGALLGAVVILPALGVIPILHMSLLAAILAVGLGTLSPDEARRSVDLNVIVLIAAAFGLASAAQDSGLAEVLADLVVSVTSAWGPRGTLFGVLLLTMLMTELVTNSAAALLVFPLALSAGASVGLDPRTMGLLLAVTASASFLTPIGYQTNMMVYGPGGYRLGDYLRLGGPLSVLVLLTLLWVAPL